MEHLNGGAYLSRSLSATSVLNGRGPERHNNFGLRRQATTTNIPDDTSYFKSAYDDGQPHFPVKSWHHVMSSESAAPFVVIRQPSSPGNECDFGSYHDNTGPVELSLPIRGTEQPPVVGQKVPAREVLLHDRRPTSRQSTTRPGDPSRRPVYSSSTRCDEGPKTTPEPYRRPKLDLSDFIFPLSVPNRNFNSSPGPTENTDIGSGSDTPVIREDPTSVFALAVEKHARCRISTRDSKADRILRALITPNPRAYFELDETALSSIFHAANEIFFYGSLKGRVEWEWSDKSTARFHRRTMGTTALRQADDGGYETMIVLSSHYLKDQRYNRRLLISTFLHELIHSYLFVRCGFKATCEGGHTDGFWRIARVIDRWAGPDTLFLSDKEADLKDFPHPHADHSSMGSHGDYGGMDFEQRHLPHLQVAHYHKLPRSEGLTWR